MNAKVNHVFILVTIVGVLLLSGCQAISLNSMVTAPDGNVYRIESVVQPAASLAAVNAASIAPAPVSAMHGEWAYVPSPVKHTRTGTVSAMHGEWEAVAAPIRHTRTGTVSAMHGEWRDVPATEKAYMWDYNTEHADISTGMVSAMHGEWQDVPAPVEAYRWDYATEHADVIIETTE